MSDIKVLYIAGWGRSGTTILDTILGQVPGLFSVGEIKFIWDRGLIENRYCGCGERFRACPFWTAVFEKAYGGMDGFAVGFTAQKLAAWPLMARTRHTPAMMLPGSEAYFRRNLAEYLDVHEKLYRAILEVSGEAMIVDSSKFPSYGYALRLIDSIDVRVLHAVRDPRAVAHSWMRRKADPGNPNKVMPYKHPFINSLYWNGWNFAAEWIFKRGGTPYLPVRYEDVMQRPKDEVIRILDFAGHEYDALPFASDTEVTMTPNHTVSGNPIRFKTGAVELKYDDEWQRKMKPHHKSIAQAVTAPFRHRYGYG